MADWRSNSRILKLVCLSTVPFVGLLLPAATSSSFAASDLYIKDQPSDSGVEPNPSSGPFWISDDIWVRSTPDPNFLPNPFPSGSPTWTPQPHENPEYRDTDYSTPNYIYVKVHNRGDAPSTGNERLRVYFAKASTGLSWPAQWEDFVQVVSGAPLLYGAEVTKPRKNAALASQAERDALVSAILAARAAPHLLPGGASSWHIQGTIHNVMSALTGVQTSHGNPGFLPWHREMVDRLERLLQKVNPTVKLLYWDWTQDPANYSTPSGPFNFFSTSFMGAHGRGSATPVSIGAPFMPDTGGPAVTRRGNTALALPTSYAGPAGPLSNTIYDNFRLAFEQTPHHNRAHLYLGGNFLNPAGIPDPSLNGNISFLPTAAQDPFFFLLHTNVDRIWAQWQRSNGAFARYVPSTAYDASSVNGTINSNMYPWDGGANLAPWNPAFGYSRSKTSKSPSVVTPSAYDTAVITVPPLAPGQAAIVEIPWYPSDPARFSSFGADAGHFCILARIETSTAAPFGMTFTETADVNGNTKNNNSIAWKNLTIVDNFPGALKMANVIVRNVFAKSVMMGMKFAEPRKVRTSIFKYARVRIDLGEKLFDRWKQGGASGRGFEPVGGTSIQMLSSRSSLDGIKLEPGDEFTVAITVEFPQNRRPRAGNAGVIDLVQIGTPDDKEAIVGGQRFEIRADKVVGVKRGSDWKFHDNNRDVAGDWNSPEYDDQKWLTGRAALGFGDSALTKTNMALGEKRQIANYYRHSFTIDDLAFYDRPRLHVMNSDGAVVYINGKEVFRDAMAAGDVVAGQLATAEKTGVARRVFQSVEFDPGVLREGKNVIAVETHLGSPKAEDSAFDLELTGRKIAATDPPVVAISQPGDGDIVQVGRAVPIQADAATAGGKIAKVEFFADGKLLHSTKAPPYAFVWKEAALGTHVIKVVATDTAGLFSTARSIINVLESAPPTVALVQPNTMRAAKMGEAINVEATAVDNGGGLDRVEFELMSMEMFSDPKIVAVAKQAPFKATVEGLEPGNYMITAVAVDRAGQRSYSTPVHVHVQH